MAVAAQLLTWMSQAWDRLPLTPTTSLRGKHSSPITEEEAEAWKSRRGRTTGEVSTGARPGSLASRDGALNGPRFWVSEHQL